MNRINLFHTATSRTTPATPDSVAWGKINRSKTNLNKNIGTLVFAALLIVCSLGVGCSSEKAKTESSTNQTAMTQPTPPLVTSPTALATPALQAAAKPVHKKVVHKAPPTAIYADQTSGVSFQYPRKYKLKTGDDADSLVASDSIPMNFVQPGGVALAAVAVPESGYPKTDLASAFFDVSVNKSLTAEQCGEFPVLQVNGSAQVDPEPQPAAQPPNLLSKPPSKLMIGDMELQAAESLTSQGTREEASKYYHVFENGACYEFALKVATTGVETEGGKQVDRDEVFHRLEKILATVKIDPVEAPEVTASGPVTPNAQGNPAQ
jgi:hypothetical protein